MPKAATLLLGFPPDQKTVMESVSRPANSSFLEALLKELTGTDWTLKLSVVEGLASTESAAGKLTEPANEPNESIISKTIRSSRKRSKFSKAKSNPSPPEL